ncbi:NAD(P)H-dependent flavin oxidoreductase [Sabulicella glaciei]|uniref:Nitronate monooxygenase family protein n=1 Tax=Sabulicella glaciei TaxID=2984948 RepID=A0ABT3P0Z6_9PROT|nr:nitronate monooxygenase family protein [Roseococcus sp. MDT2-1-1]MCW8088078.1 nitronate monooxygenase family protein [Roseococcus sp. MDT2-1-1]
MDLRDTLKGRLRLPLIGSPLFIISVPDLVVAQCTSGVIGSMPSLNARPLEQLDEWLHEIKERLAAHDARHPDRPSAPFAINLIVHKSNDRLEQDLALCVKHRVPLIITSLGARVEVNEAIHSYGGHVIHDVINQTFAHKAIEKGADGLVLVAAGAGGHAGSQSPFALLQETRAWFDGPVALSGSIAHGRSILAAEAMGADFAYMGTAFIATEEARAVEDYKRMLVESGSSDIVYTNLITGVHGNYLKPSVRNAGLDPDNLETGDKSQMNFASDRKKRWKDVWGAGQSVSGIGAVVPASRLVDRLHAEYQEARRALGAGSPMLNRAWERTPEPA